MVCSISDLKKKEVIDIRTGEKLGFIDDAEINPETSEILSLIIYGRRGFFGLYKKEPDYVIRCSEIKVIGQETLLISPETGSYQSKTGVKPANFIKSKKFVYKNLFDY